MTSKRNQQQANVSRRSLMKGAAGAAALSAIPGAAAAAPRVGRTAPAMLRRFQGEELTVLYMESGTYDEAARLIAPEFEEATGATVTVVAFPYQNLHDNAATDLITETGAYDVMSVAYQWDGEFAPFLSPLDDLIERDGFDMEGFIPNIATLSGLWEGNRNGIPQANDARGIVYRTDLFEAAGLERPASWQEYNEHAAALTTDDVYGASWVGLGEQLQGSWLSRYWEQGQPLCAPDWTPLFNSEEGVRAVELLREALPYAPAGMPGWDIPTHNNAVLGGELAQAELWPSFIRADLRDPELSSIVDSWGLMPFPGPSELSAWNLAIPATTGNRDLAWEWIKMYTSPENQKRFAVEFGIGSPRIETWEDPELLAAYPEYPEIYAAIQAGRPIWRIPQFPAAWDVLQSELELTVYQDADPQETLDRIADEWNRLLEQDPPTSEYVEG